MSVWNGLRRLWSRARDEATEAAQVAKIRLDIRSLEGRRDHLFREIGRKVYEARNDNSRFEGMEPVCAEIDTVAAKIRERQRDLEALRGRAGGAPAPAPEAGPTSA